MGEVDDGRDERRYDRWNEREEARAPVDEVRDVDEANDRRVAPASIRHPGASAADEEQDARGRPRRADEPGRGPAEPPPDLGDPEADRHVHQRRDAEQNAQKPRHSAVPSARRLFGLLLDVLGDGRSGQTPSSLTSVSLLVTPT